MNTLDKEQLLALCRYGSLAPSVHNAQPWSFTLVDGKITIQPSKERTLDAGDPVGRELWISIGACVENIVVAAQASGYATNVVFGRTKRVTLTFSPSRTTTESLPVESIKKRFTDRSRFHKQTIEAKKLAAIETGWKSDKTKIITTTDPHLIALVAQFTEKGIGLALGTPAFRRELSSLINTPLRKNQKVGISSASLRLNPMQSLFEPYLIKSGISVGKKARKERELWEHTPALVLTLSKGDTPAYWLDAGRAYEHAALTATQLGLRQATSAALVEAADYHVDIEKYLGEQWRLQTVMRVGYSKVRPTYSPRLPLSELLT